MTKERLKELQKKNCIMDCEIGDAIYFVNDLVEEKAEELERDEPYATTTILNLRDAAYHVFCLMDDIDDLTE